MQRTPVWERRYFMSNQIITESLNLCMQRTPVWTDSMEAFMQAVNGLNLCMQRTPVWEIISTPLVEYMQ